MIDPLGLALENFNAIGQWRDKDIDAGTLIDATGQLADGTQLTARTTCATRWSPGRDQIVQNFTENLLTYRARPRSSKYYDMPRVRDDRPRPRQPTDYRFSATVVRASLTVAAFQTDRRPRPRPKPATVRKLPNRGPGAP